MNSIMFVSQSLAAILDFGGNIEIIKIMYSSVFVYIYTLISSLTFDIRLKMCSMLAFSSRPFPFQFALNTSRAVLFFFASLPGA